MVHESSSDRAWMVLVSLYLGAIVTANAMASKLMVVGPAMVTVGALAIPIVYLTTDLLNELYGARATRAVVWMGLLANVVLVAMSQLALAMPPSSMGATPEQFAAVFDSTPRIVFASLTAYLCSSMWDVSLFHWFKRLTNGKHFWIRKNGSTFISQLADSAIFAVLAFGGVIPVAALIPMTFAQYGLKIIAAPLGTPLSYLVLRFARTKE